MLTERQQQILDWIVAYTNDQGRVPSIREIMNAFGMKSPNGVHGHLKALRKKGYLGQRGGHTPRDIVIESNEGFDVQAIGKKIAVRVDRHLNKTEARGLCRELRRVLDELELGGQPIIESGNGSISAIDSATLVCNEAEEMEVS